MLALLYKRLTERDFRVLLSVEAGLARFEYVPVEFIVRKSRLPESVASSVLSKLNKLKLLERRVGNHIGYRLTYLGMDIIALHSLVERGVVHALGDKLGVGKESEVYSGLTPSGDRIIVKFHKLGRTSFHKVARVRPYVVDRPYMSWLQLARIAGQREFRALDELYKAGALVPKPLGYSRHAVVTEYVWGVELYRYTSAQDPEAILAKVLDTVRKAYLDVGIVHGDLSEYNIIVSVEEDGNEVPYVIDWPQYVERDNPAAESLLRRDVEYIVKFFNKKYKLNVDLEKALRYVKGEAESL
ncbi:MAG: RIO1 family regulatory kinase/ATPase [Thermoproteota archaeon]